MTSSSKARKGNTSKEASSKRASSRQASGKKSTRKKAPRCKTCGAAIRVPEGWSAGSAARKHYWRKHPEVMTGKGSR